MLVEGGGVDFGLTAADYARYRAGFPASLYGRLERLGVGFAERAFLDIGAGTGSLARGFAERGARVAALDPAAPLMQQGRALAPAAGIAWARGRAEELPFADGAFDAVSAGQCWHWFEHDRALAEVRRVLRPGGRVIIANFDWLPTPGGVAAASEALILEHNPKWRGDGGDGFHTDWLPRAEAAGLRDSESFSYIDPTRYSPEAWRGRIRASAGIAASLDAERVAAFDAAHAAMLARDFPGEALLIPHRVFVATGRFGGRP